MNETEEIKSHLPIEQVVGNYIPLKKAGRIFKGNCPFHNEKTPSFTVSPERGIYKCFGCGEGGDIFDFVMKIDGLSFPEALQLLADKAGVVLPEKNPQAYTDVTPRERLFKLNSQASKLWHTILLKHPKAETARTYVHGRGLTNKTLEDFQIGYAPPGNVTLDHLKQQNFIVKELKDAGEPGRFQDRIIFPITDITGKTIGFTGRLLQSEDDPKTTANRGPKYWNTPETPIFHKSRAVYGLNLAKRKIQDENLAVLAEGQMDVAMLHQAGFTNAVASSGTAITAEQVQLIGRFSSNIAIAYDSDKAGREATKKAIELILNAELNPFIVVVPNGLDPADCIQKGPELWKKAYQNKLSFMQWLIDHAIENKELTPVTKKDITQSLLPWLRRIKSEVERAEWTRFLAIRLQTDEKNISAALGRFHSPEGLPKNQQSDESRPNTSNNKLNKAEVAMALDLTFPNIVSVARDQLPTISSNSTPFIEEVMPFIENWQKHFSDDQKKQISLRIQELLYIYEEQSLDESVALEEFHLITARLRSEAKEGTKARLAREIQLAQQENDIQKLQRLFLELKELV